MSQIMSNAVVIITPLTSRRQTFTQLAAYLFFIANKIIGKIQDAQLLLCLSSELLCIYIYIIYIIASIFIFSNYNLNVVSF